MLTPTNILSTAINVAWTDGKGLIKSYDGKGGLLNHLPKLIIPAITALFSFEAANSLYPTIAGRVRILPTNSYAGIVGMYIFGALLAQFTRQFVETQIQVANNWSKG